MKGSKVRHIVGQVAGFLPSAGYAALGGVGVVAVMAPDAKAGLVLSSATGLVVPATTAGLYINVVSGVSNIAPASAPGWDLNPFSSTLLSWFNPTTPSGGVMMRYPGVTTGTPVGSLDVQRGGRRRLIWCHNFSGRRFCRPVASE